MKMHRKLFIFAQFSVQSRLDLFHDLFLNSINKYIAIQFDTKTTILYYSLNIIVQWFCETPESFTRVGSPLYSDDQWGIKIIIPESFTNRRLSYA
jgi:hypothetical protein